ncbi:hypothetical protein QUW57_05740 [Phocaeicola plebeius]|uniref:hypothetical protein n=1 Tax=Phocaeicola plebeius TaxID=310297 RepID=UPI0021AC26CF|nr:hypothetical protein [Phocaeicola plebeius]MCR8882504.1 hypothetical protein [Phocaeicola plebeius]MDM8286082.1 hypothetical protein [Phocaeicola plebeius]
MSPTTAAGSLPISTFGTPGPTIGPPTWGMGGSPGVCIGQVCMSVSLAAGGIGSSFLSYMFYFRSYIVFLFVS